MAKASEPIIQDKRSLDADVMGAMQGSLPSDSKKLDVIQILRNYFYKNGSNVDSNYFINFISKACESPDVSLIQINNSLFLTIRKSNDEVEFQIISPEMDKMLNESVIGYTRFLKNQKIKKATIKTSTGSMVEFFKSLGLPVQVSTGTKVGRGKAQPVYLASIEIGE